MDIPRVPRSRRPDLFKFGLGLTSVIAITVLLASLKPAVPTVQRATVLIDSVRRGEFLRTVAGAGSLVPEQIRWIAALTPARVDRILAQPGDSVQAETVLLELSNPDVQIQALDAQQQLTSADAQLVNLRTQLESQRLTQEAQVAQVHTSYNEAQRAALVAETLAVKGLSSPFELGRARDQADEASTRLKIEEQRLRLLTASMAPQLRVQEEQVARLRAISLHRQNEILGLSVRAGERGVLQEMPLQLGQWVTPGMVLARVVQPSRLKAVLRIPETQATEVQIGQHATIDTRNGLIRGRVVRIDPASQGGAVGVEIVLDGALPPGARPELSVDGTIEIDRLSNVLYTGRPAFVRPGTDNTISLFKVVDGGGAAVRVVVKVGKTSLNGIQIVEGLEAGDRVIVSDMSRWDHIERLRLK